MYQLARVSSLNFRLLTFDLLALSAIFGTTAGSSQLQIFRVIG